MNFHVRQVPKATVDPVHVAFSSETALLMRAEADRRGVTPQMLALAVMHTVLKDQLTESVFDGERPENLAPGHGKAKNGLTKLRCAVLYVLAMHAGEDGICRMSANQISVLVNASSSGGVSSALLAMEARGLILRVGNQETVRAAAHWRLTEDGQMIADRLGALGYGRGGWA